MTEDIFNKLETDMMKVLTKEPDRSFTQYELYSKLLDDQDIKDPIEKENLKFRFLVVLRKLSSIFDGVQILNKNGVLSVTFKTVDKMDDFSENKNDSDSNSDKDYLEEDLKEDYTEMPSEISVIQFIIDENIEKYYSKKDYDGNTILHKLVLYSDLERFKKIYLRDDVSLSDLNNNNKTPIDLITDIKISNLLISHLIENSKNSEYELLEMKNRIKSLDDELFKLYLQFNCLQQLLILYLIWSVIKYLFF